MLISKPDYYDEFHCTADKCKDTCCAGWQIVVDEDSLKRYRRVVQTAKARGEFRKGTNSFAKYLHESVDWAEGVFYQDEEKRCAFLNRNNLCDLYTALGKESLCRTCQNYPRHIEEFENVREYTLSLSCPEVAEILLHKREPVFFLEAEEPGEEEFEDFDFLLYDCLTEARKVILRILQNRELDISLRALLIWELGRELQEYQDEGRLFDCEALFERYESRKIREELQERLEKWKADGNLRYQTSKECFANLYKLEVLRGEWEVHLQQTAEVLYTTDGEAYQELEREFEEWLQVQMPEYVIWLEQLMVYFVQTYFCGAVYNDYIRSKTKLAAVSAWLIYEMLAARWCRNGKTLEMDDVIEIVYRYSRELEHSDENLGKMDELLDEEQKR